MIQKKTVNLEPYGASKTKTFLIEKFSCLSDLERGIEAKGESIHDPRRDFFINSPSDPDFNGFESPEELRTLLKSGVSDTSAVRQVCRLRAAKNAGSVIKTRRFDLMGEEVDIPAFLSGVPECMIDEVRVRKPYRSVRLLIDPGVHCGYTGKQLIEVGLIISRLIMALEKAGRSVHLTIYDGFVAHEKPEVYLMSCDIKRSGTPLNAKKLLMCTHPSFFRGAGFTWVTRTADYRLSGLGMPMSGLMEDHGDTLQFMKDHVFHEKEVYLLRSSDILEKIADLNKTNGWEDRLVNQLFEEFIR